MVDFFCSPCDHRSKWTIGIIVRGCVLRTTGCFFVKNFANLLISILLLSTYIYLTLTMSSRWREDRMLYSKNCTVILLTWQWSREGSTIYSPYSIFSLVCVQGTIAELAQYHLPSMQPILLGLCVGNYCSLPLFFLRFIRALGPRLRRIFQKIFLKVFLILICLVVPSN